MNYLIIWVCGFCALVAVLWDRLDRGGVWWLVTLVLWPITLPIGLILYFRQRSID